MRISDWSSDVCSSDLGVRYPVVDIAVIDNPQVESVGPLQEVLDLRVLAHKAPAGHGVAAVGQGELRTGRPLYRHPGVYAGIDCFLAHLEYEDSHLPTSLRSVSHSQLSGERLSLAVRLRVKFSRAIWRPIRRATRRTAASIRCSASAVSAQSPLAVQASGRSWSLIIANPFPGDSGQESDITVPAIRVDSEDVKISASYGVFEAMAGGMDADKGGLPRTEERR